MRPTATGALVLAFLAMSALAQQQLEVGVSNETAPPGSAVQIKVLLTTPKPILSGQLSVSLDPTLFGEISQPFLARSAMRPEKRMYEGGEPRSGFPLLREAWAGWLAYLSR